MKTRKAWLKKSRNCKHEWTPIHLNIYHEYYEEDSKQTLYSVCLKCSTYKHQDVRFDYGQEEQADDMRKTTLNLSQDGENK